MRIGFAGGPEILTTDILNCGASPRRLVEIVKRRFLGAGGVLLEGTDFRGSTIHPNGALVRLNVSERAVQVKITKPWVWFG